MSSSNTIWPRIAVSGNAPALLFDLDGTLVDTDALHLQAFNDLLARFDRHIDEEYYKRHVMGFSHEQIMGAMFPAASSEEKRAYAEEKEQLVRGLFDRELEPLPGLLEFLRHAESAGCAMAVVTNAPRENARSLLRGLGMEDRFETIVYGEELEFGKPHPLPYLMALELLGAEATHAFAFEDSRSGVRAAAAAGIRTFGVRTSLSDEQLREAGAFVTIQDYRDAELHRHWRALLASGAEAAPNEDMAAPERVMRERS
jgi:HAD superfamily hydrolase (TIGR01509 family)